MSEFFWPDDTGLGLRVRRAWPTVVEALPIGTRVTGTVIGRQPFGVFILIDQMANAVGLMRVTELPPEKELLPLRGAQVVGEVLWHNEKNWQISMAAVGHREDAAWPSISEAELLALRRRLQGDPEVRGGVPDS